MDVHGTCRIRRLISLRDHSVSAFLSEDSIEYDEVGPLTRPWTGLHWKIVVRLWL